MIKAYILDLNGIFLKSPWLTSRMQERWGISTEDSMQALKEIMNTVRKPGAPSVYSLWKPYFDRWNIEISEEEFLNWWFKGEELQHSAIEFAVNLRERGIKVFILSNNFRERTTYYRTNFPEMFSSVDKAYFSWETGFVKPGGEALELVLKENNLQPEDVIYVDDSGENRAVAEDLGIRSFEDITNIEVD